MNRGEEGSIAGPHRSRKVFPELNIKRARSAARAKVVRETEGEKMKERLLL